MSLDDDLPLDGPEHFTEAAEAFLRRYPDGYRLTVDQVAAALAWLGVAGRHRQRPAPRPHLPFLRRPATARVRRGRRPGATTQRGERMMIRNRHLRGSQLATGRSPGVLPMRVACPRCGARPNESCVQMRGIGGGGYAVPLMHPHGERKAAARGGAA